MRKSKQRLERNIGGSYQAPPPSLSTAFDAVLLTERVLASLLRTTFDTLKNDNDELMRFLTHFFDPTAEENAIEEFAERFRARTPKVVIGYARSAADFPCLAIVMESEDEAESFLADHLGEERDPASGQPAEYTGAFWDSVYGVYIYAEHPDECMLLYQFAKSVIHAGKGFLISCGLADVHLSGGELAPDESYMPDNLFVRVLRVTAKAPMAVPHLLSADPRRIRLAGIHREDVVVDGLRGGVSTYDPEDADE